MIRVMVFGTFDNVHPGHKYLLSEAKKMGDFLTVVIARDQTVAEVKHRQPEKNENQRLQEVTQLNIADKVILGNLGDKYQVIKDENPDIIALGYDQKAFTENLPKVIDKDIKIVRIKPFKEDIFKSSILRQK